MEGRTVGPAPFLLRREITFVQNDELPLTVGGGGSPACECHVY